jgi:hypothetical protein
MHNTGLRLHDLPAPQHLPLQRSRVRVLDDGLFLLPQESLCVSRTAEGRGMGVAKATGGEFEGRQS